MSRIEPVPPGKVRPEDLKPPKVDPTAVLFTAAGGPMVPVEPTLRVLLEAVELLLMAAEVCGEPRRKPLFDAVKEYLETPSPSSAESLVAGPSNPTGAGSSERAPSTPTGGAK